MDYLLKYIEKKLQNDKYFIKYKFNSEIWNSLFSSENSALLLEIITNKCEFNSEYIGIFNSTINRIWISTLEPIILNLIKYQILNLYQFNFIILQYSNNEKIIDYLLNIYDFDKKIISSSLCKNTNKNIIKLIEFNKNLQNIEIICANYNLCHIIENILLNDNVFHISMINWKTFSLNSGAIYIIENILLNTSHKLHEYKYLIDFNWLLKNRNIYKIFDNLIKNKEYKTKIETILIAKYRVSTLVTVKSINSHIVTKINDHNIPSIYKKTHIYYYLFQKINLRPILKFNKLCHEEIHLSKNEYKIYMNMINNELNEVDIYSDKSIRYDIIKLVVKLFELINYGIKENKISLKHKICSYKNYLPIIQKYNLDDNNLYNNKNAIHIIQNIFDDNQICRLNKLNWHEIFSNKNALSIIKLNDEKKYIDYIPYTIFKNNNILLYDKIVELLNEIINNNYKHEYWNTNEIHSALCCLCNNKNINIILEKLNISIKENLLNRLFDNNEYLNILIKNKYFLNSKWHPQYNNIFQKYMDIDGIYVILYQCKLPKEIIKKIFMYISLI